MNGKYDKIMGLPHHVSKTRPQMPMSDRAAQFAPFAALTGYDSAIKETGRLTDERIELDEEALTALDMKYQLLMDTFDSGQEIQKYSTQDVSSFISGVMVHPGAKPEYVKIIGTLSEVFSLNFYGKSKIHELDTSLFQPNEQNDISQTAQGGLKWMTRG